MQMDVMRDAGQSVLDLATVAREDAPDPLLIDTSCLEAKTYCLIDNVGAGDSHVNHTQRPCGPRPPHHANSRRRIEATVPLAARPTQVKRESAYSSTLTGAPAKGKQRPPAGKTTGGKPALAPARAPNAIPTDDGDEGGNEVDLGGIMEMLLRIETKVGSFSDQVKSLRSRVEVVETRLGIEHAAS